LLFALGQPFAVVGLLIGFLLALVLRAFAIRFTARSLGLVERREALGFRPREDVDPFGAVAAAVAGVGWGRIIDVDEVPRFRGRGRAALVFAAGPIVTIVAAQIFFLACRLLFPNLFGLAEANLSDYLRWQFGAPWGIQVLLGIATALLGFGLVNLLPIPPLDGFGLLWSAQRQIGTGIQGYRLWFQEKNIGVVVLIACCFFPLNNPLLLLPVDLLGTVFLALWG
jgi:hypothetical protein